MPFCRKCGEELSEDSSFCTNCGTSQQVVNAQPQPNPVVPPRAPSPALSSQGKKYLTWGIVGVVGIIALIALLAIASNPALLSSNPAAVFNPPKPEITSVSGYDSLEGFDYVFKVDATVKNNGGAGSITVFAEINGAGRYEKLSKTVYLSKGESQSLNFKFDISVWGSLGNPTINYKAWAVAS